MKISKSIQALALAGAILSPVASSEARAANYITNFSSTPPPSSITSNPSFGFFANVTYPRAILFNSSSSFQLTEISLALASSNSYSPTDFSLELYASNGSTPTGSALASATSLTVTTGDYNAGTGSVNTFNSSNASALFSYTASAGNYALVLGGATDTAIYMHNSIPSPTANGALSFLGMASYNISSPNAWAAEVNQKTYFAIGTTGTGPSSPSSVPDAGSSAAGLGLAVAGLIHLRRRRQNAVTA